MPRPDEWRLNRAGGRGWHGGDFPSGDGRQSLEQPEFSLFNSILTPLRQGAAGTGVASIPFMESGIAQETEPIRSFE
jgi:hypothetical protein